MVCAVCHRDQARVNSDRAECCVVECPHRRRQTAMPHDHIEPSGYESSGCYRVTPTTKDQHEH